MNAPWGLAMAPASFGPFGGDLLIGNFGDGVIQVFKELGDGSWDHQGILRDKNRLKFSIDGLWALEFGNAGSNGNPGTLFFTAGPGGRGPRALRLDRAVHATRTRIAAAESGAARHLRAAPPLAQYEHLFYSCAMRAEYREEPCRSALTRVRGMPFGWSLNPYMGCVHRCTFCYVRAFEQRADRPADDRYGRSIRVKTNVVEVLRAELARASWKREQVSIGAATDPYQPAEGRYRLTRGCVEALAAARTPLAIITRGPLVVRDVDVLQEAARRGGAQVNVSIPTLDEEVWRRTEPGTAPPAQRLRALKTLVDAGIRAGRGHGADPAGPVRPARAAGSGRTRGPRRGRDAPLGQPAAPAAGHARALPPTTWRATGRRSSSATGGSTPAARTSRASCRRTCGRRSRELRERHGLRDRRTVRLEPQEEPEQLALAV